MDWVKAKAQKEGKSLSLLITEILETARQKEVNPTSQSSLDNQP